MTARERVIKTLRHEEVDRFPRMLWQLPNVEMFQPDNLRDFHSRFENDMEGPDLRWGHSRYSKGLARHTGAYTDEFGCTFELAEPGVNGEVKKPVLADWKALKDYRLPWEIIEQADFSKVNESCLRSDKFILASAHIHPFERLQHLRGTENIFMDMAMGVPEAETLLAMLHEFYLRELELVANTAADGFQFMDDWGTQTSLLISPVLWRQLFKPLYRDYCDLLHAKGKFVFFHSDGNIEMIYPDLVEIGVDAINSQLFCMDIEKLVENYGDKITFYGEIDRQYILPFGSVEDVRNAVRRVANAVMRKNGKRTGAFAQCEWNAIDPYENIVAVFEQWDKI